MTGDQYLGNLIVGLDLYSPDFDVLAPHFKWGTDNEHILQAIELCFGPIIKEFDATHIVKGFLLHALWVWSINLNFSRVLLWRTQSIHSALFPFWPANVFCGNQGVVRNASIPELTLMKKHNAINYHAVQEAAAAGILCVGKEDGKTNIADLLMKVLYGKKCWNICWHIMWWRGCQGSTSCD